MRALHTFKGGARLAGAMRLGEMAHRLETAIERQTAQSLMEPATLARSTRAWTSWPRSSSVAQRRCRGAGAVPPAPPRCLSRGCRAGAGGLAEALVDTAPDAAAAARDAASDDTPAETVAPTVRVDWAASWPRAIRPHLRTGGGRSGADGGGQRACARRCWTAW
jgi:chemosensory pili system protein ChpA (sensor histidine kinase/response regulator)